MPAISISDEESLRAQLESTDASDRLATTGAVSELAGDGLAPQALYGAGHNPVAVAIADFNGDGYNDVVDTASADATMSIFINNGNGTLKTRVAYAAAATPNFLATGDFNGDGRIDVLTAANNSSHFSLFKGNGDGTFQGETAVLGTSNARAVVAADFTGDGKLDLAVSDHNRIALIKGNGDGTFQVPTYSTVTNPTNQLAAADLLAAGDFNHDGRLDLVVTDSLAIYNGTGLSTYGAYVMLNNGTGGFTQGQMLRVGDYVAAQALAVGDVTGDGNPDIYLAHDYAGHPLYIGNGDGTFQQTVGPSYNGSTGNPRAAAIGDLNGDGYADIAVADHIGQVLLFGSTSRSIDPGGNPIALALGDLNGDGKLDIVTANDRQGSVTVLLNTPYQFGTPALATSQFGAGPAGGGWTSQNLYPRLSADVNGDGRADIVAFGEYGVSVALGQANGSFGAMNSDIRAFGHDPSSGGLTSNDTYPRFLADVNGDGKADIVGIGDAGVYVSLATVAWHFANPILAVAQFGVGASAGGWTNETLYARQLGDVNGDGMADMVGFGAHGVYVSLATGGGHFAMPTFELNKFGSDPDGGNFTSNDTYPRYVADVNGDGMADIVGFGDAGVFVSLATGGGHFAQPVLAIHQFGHDAAAGGWSSNSLYPREVGDINGDGRADIVGFGEYGLYYALGQADGTFGPITNDRQIFGRDPSHGGLTNDDLYPRMLADVNGDGLTDIIATGDNGLYVATANHVGGDFLFT